MDTAQWPQEIVLKPMVEEMVVVPNGSRSTTINTPSCSSKQPAAGGSSSVEIRKVRPQKEQALNCPRCNSTNTKFCYYNNYSLSQPRYFCKTCRRYWTEGGSLRNIPVGGGSRKNKRSSSSSSNSILSSSSKKLPGLIIPPSSHQNPTKIINIHEDQGRQDLNLGFSSSSSHDFKTISDLIQVPNFDDHNNKENSSSSNNNNNISSAASTSCHLSALELLTAGITPAIRGLNSFMPMPNITTDPTSGVVYSSSGGFQMPEFKPSTLSFSLDHGMGSLVHHGHVPESAGGGGSRPLLFPFEDLKVQVSLTPPPTTSTDHQNRDHHAADSTGYWSGVLGGGGGSW